MQKEKRITINVGGREFSSYPSTLKKSPILDALISRWSVPGEELFLDRDPDYFEKVLKHLRGYEVELDGDELNEAKNFYGLDLEIGSKMSPESLKEYLPLFLKYMDLAFLNKVLKNSSTPVGVYEFKRLLEEEKSFYNFDKKLMDILHFVGREEKVKDLFDHLEFYSRLFSTKPWN